MRRARRRSYEQIGRLKMQLEWLKKKRSESVEARRSRLEWTDCDLSLRERCDLLGLNRSTVYYRPVGETEENLCLMRRIDEQYLKTPWYGSRRMTVWLGQHGFAVNRKRVQRLMRLMDLKAIYPKPRTTDVVTEHRKLPYLLRDRVVTQPDEV